MAVILACFAKISHQCVPVNIGGLRDKDEGAASLPSCGRREVEVAHIAQSLLEVIEYHGRLAVRE